ncbi:non-hydrolyzing UDP-N-acetylglucosamine 2-epimerase [Microbacterium sp. SS28]|uniref:non-hydrolyzing UDP-N-acetylglucosamine 2-epimerase n=1 Tax=Microbacterium sp. SS28 TaxID=2919948 RepID=UPI001FAA7A56|nr:UDP-N-acetylglucosamine 2-epimerase (non-hydrolyzing) [Microbacterium sp. SS28]
MATEDSSHLNALFVVGTRPEAIKMLPLIAAMRDSDWFHPIVVSTGQHAELVAQVLAIDGIVPDVTFDMPKGPRGLNELFAKVMLDLNQYLLERVDPPRKANVAPFPDDYPAACFVHGDTTSAAAAAVTAFHRHLPVIHVEAGLRTSDTLSPFPEELNRQLISRIAALHIAPTISNKANLVREGIDFARVFVTGNTAIDALRIAADHAEPYSDPQLADLEDEDGPRVVAVTAHRRENWGAPLARIADAVGILAEEHPDVRFVVALHPNPEVADTLRGRLFGHANISLVAPMEYAEFARLLKRATFAITDSGGVQEEAPSLQTPVLCVRESTERQEGVAAGTVELVGTDVVEILRAARRLLADPEELARRRARENPYGDGHAADRILKALEHIAYGYEAPTAYGPRFARSAVLRAGGRDDEQIGFEGGWPEGWAG